MNDENAPAVEAASPAKNLDFDARITAQAAQIAALADRVAQLEQKPAAPAAGEAKGSKK